MSLTLFIFLSPSRFPFHPMTSFQARVRSLSTGAGRFVKLEGLAMRQVSGVKLQFKEYFAHVPIFLRQA
jgi:hypothetical protein